MTNRLLKKFGVDIFFIFIGGLVLFSILMYANIIDILYFCCIVYYYVKIKIYRWKNCH